MDTFLKIVAGDLFGKYGRDLSRVALIFPNKRAGLFFNEYLAAESDTPIWSPSYTNISELLQSLSPLRVADSIGLICDLYAVYREETQSDEPLDDFYFWGELLLSDFDDIDKNLVDAGKLFANLKDLKVIMDDVDFLDKEQEAAIRQFFQNFSVEKRTELKEKFISIWQKLGDVYTGFRERLSGKGVAYEGMVYKDAISRMDAENLPFDKYVFVGFNILNKVEFQLFDKLQKAGKAMFYWDYDVFYTNDSHTKHEAGMYMNRNLTNFPSPLGRGLFDNLSGPKNIRLVASSTENAQARFLPQWLDSVPPGKESLNAVVLCNESLLLPVLHSIPPGVENVNITMGFPLAQTPVYAFIEALLGLQTDGYNHESGRYGYHFVQAVLKHPYVGNLSPHADALIEELTKNNHFYPLPSELQKDDVLALIFTPSNGTIPGLCVYISELLRKVASLYRQDREGEDEDIFNQLYRESLFKGYTVMNRMLNLVESGELNVKQETFRRLLRRLLSATHIPFHGEPAVGMQIMGVLETRNLDFRNLVIMSLNEGLLPLTGENPSFIPHTLRKAFGMTTVEYKDAIYAYYFYRMIQRAENITLLYNTSSGGLNRGEPSRYILQLLVEWPHRISREFLGAGQLPRTPAAVSVDKTPDVIEILHNTYNTRRNPQGRFSPSALNTYMDCNLKFYYRYVARLKEADDVSTQIDSSMFGSIFHRSVELIYKKILGAGNQVTKEDLEKLLKEERIIRDAVDTAFKELFFHIPTDEKSEYNGTQLINSRVIATYARQLLRNDLLYTPFEMVAMEKKVGEEFTIETTGGTTPIRIGGIIDRIDRKDGTMRIVDYKTGGYPKTPTGIETLFTPSDDRPGYIFQAFLYAAIVCRQHPELKIAPALMYIHRAASDMYSPVIEMGEPRKPKTAITDFSMYDDEFRENLRQLLEEIFNPEIPFCQTANKKSCGYCEYRTLCGS